MDSVPPLMTSVVVPAAVNQHQMVGLEIAAAIEVAIVVRAGNPRGGQDRQHGCQEWQRDDRQQGAEESADQRNLADRVVDGPKNRVGGRTHISGAVALDFSM